jgi:hypothetical protein
MTPSGSRLMPTAVAEVYDPLWQEVQNIHFTWMLYRQLFGTSPDRVELLNRFAGAVFGTMQRILGRYIPLTIFRLLDPSTQRGGRGENLCLERLAEVVTAAGAPVGGKLTALLTQIRAKMASHADLRNKVIAHNDLATTPALYDGTSSVSGPSRALTEEVLENVRTFMNTVQNHYGEGTTAYWDVSMGTPGDGEMLIRKLAESRR